MNNVQKLQEYLNGQKKNGLIGVNLSTKYDGNLLADTLVKCGVTENEVARFRVDIPDKEQIMEKMAGEILEMINAPIIEDNDLI